jgi:hypothetical protein
VNVEASLAKPQENPSVEVMTLEQLLLHAVVFAIVRIA